MNLFYNLVEPANIERCKNDSIEMQINIIKDKVDEATIYFKEDGFDADKK